MNRPFSAIFFVILLALAPMCGPEARAISDADGHTRWTPVAPEFDCANTISESTDGQFETYAIALPSGRGGATEPCAYSVETLPGSAETFVGLRFHGIASGHVAEFGAPTGRVWLFPAGMIFDQAFLSFDVRADDERTCRFEDTQFSCEVRYPELGFQRFYAHRSFEFYSGLSSGEATGWDSAELSFLAQLPEPATVALFGVALLILAGVHRRSGESASFLLGTSQSEPPTR